MTLAPGEITRLSRAKREIRHRDRTWFPITGHDEAVFWTGAFARRELLRQPEVRDQLDAIAAVGADRLAYWTALVGLATDLEPIFDACTLDHLLRGLPVLAVAGGVGRPGIEKRMTVPAIHLAVRSIALRAPARELLNREREQGYRASRQRGHEHARGERAHGAARADQLAADEVNEREQRTVRYRIKAATVTKHRERLSAVLRGID